MKQPRNNKLQIVRIAAPMIEEQEESLKTLKDLLEQEETVSSLSFNKNNEELIHTPYRTIKECTFSGLTFRDCQLKAAQFTDVRFENCDLSNISFAESSLYRVEFISCKLETRRTG